MRKYSKMIKPFDIIMVVLLLIISFVPMAVFAMNQGKEEEGNKVMAVITQDGKVIREVGLSVCMDNSQCECVCLFQSVCLCVCVSV